MKFTYILFISTGNILCKCHIWPCASCCIYDRSCSQSIRNLIHACHLCTNPSKSQFTRPICDNSSYSNTRWATKGIEVHQESPEDKEELKGLKYNLDYVLLMYYGYLWLCIMWTNVWSLNLLMFYAWMNWHWTWLMPSWLSYFTVVIRMCYRYRFWLWRNEKLGKTLKTYWRRSLIAWGSFINKGSSGK